MIRFLKWTALVLTAIFGAIVIVALLWPEKSYHVFQPSAAFTDEAIAFPLTPLPDDWSDYNVSAADGTRIYWGQTENRASDKASVILVPGFKGSMMKKGDVVAFARARGYHVVGMDQRGQGRSGKYREDQPEKLYVDEFKTYADDVRRVIEAANIPPAKPVILMGTSFGAASVTRSAGEFDLPIDGLVTLVPAYRPNTAPYSYGTAKTITKTLRLIGKSTYYAPGQTNWKPYSADLTQPSDCSSYPPRLYETEALFVRHPEQRVGGATVQWLAEIMANGELVTTPEFGAKLSLPMHMVLASTDDYVDNALAAKACRESFANCQLTQIPNSGHCITMENDIVLNQVYDVLDALYERVKKNTPK